MSKADRGRRLEPEASGAGGWPIQVGKSQPDDSSATHSMPITPRIASHIAPIWPMINIGRIDRRSIAIAGAGGLGYFALAGLGLTLWQVDAVWASVWMPNACMVALLLLAKLRNEIPALAAIALASLAAHAVTGTAPHVAGIATLAHLVDVALVTALVRQNSSTARDGSGLMRLSPILQFGGVIGPLAMCAILAITFGPDWSVLSSWLLADSMGMILIVPTVMVIAQVLHDGIRPQRGSLIERMVLMGGGLAAVFFVFQQNLYPLMFLIPPVTLLIAFRVGALGTALYVPVLAIVAAWMTMQGIGPIAQSVPDELVQTHLLQAFIAANFLTGLPIVAILAGRAQVTRELTHSRSELALLADNITDAVLWVDTNRICTYASPSVRQVLGREPEELVGLEITSRTHEDAHERIVGVLDRLLSGQSDTERLTYRRLHDAEDGSPVFIEADCAIVIEPHGERSGIVVSARDVTARVELELELTRARSTAEKATHAKSEFLANMSHEIRTPMNGVLGFAELMLQGELDEESRSHTEMIVQSGRSMMLLLNDILDLSKIEAGQIVIDRQPVDLIATVTECVGLHRATAAQKGLAVRFHLPCSPKNGCAVDCWQCDRTRQKPWVMTDGLRLRQIILNLVGNAVKFTEEGSVEILCDTDDEGFTIAVKDTGIGISSRRLETIFAPFTQGESNTARRFGGTGLGLTISRQLADLLGGKITVESEVGAGSVFRLTVPAQFIEPVETDEPAPTAAQKQSIIPAELPQSARILLVEDHDVNRLLGVDMLERCGQSVAIAHDGNEAIAMVIDSVMRGAPYDLILMDIQMPGCDGYAATRAIRADGIGPDQLPIIALTANAFPEDIAAAREAGMQAHLAKPLVFTDLARALQRWLPTRIVSAQNDAADDPKDTAQDTCDAPEGAPFETAIIDTSRPASNTKRIGDRTSGEVLAQEQSLPRLPATPRIPMQDHSPALLSRWNQRRCEAIEAVRNALEKGTLSDESLGEESFEQLVRLVHKLAGTAAIFGEPELGDQAAALEHALKMRLSNDVREALAFELLSVADDPVDSAQVAGG